MHRITERAAAEMRALPGVREVGGHVGRAITSDQVAGVDSGEMWVRMKGSADYGRRSRPSAGSSPAIPAFAAAS